MTTRSKVSADASARETTAEALQALALSPELADLREISSEDFKTAVEAWLPGYAEWSHAA